MRLYFFYISVLVLTSLLIGACSDSTPVGSVLLGNEDLEVVFEDDFDLSATTVITEPTLTYTAQNNSIQRHLVGQFNDPVFGASQSSFYFQMQYFGDIIPNYEGSTLDSGVLMLQLDTTFFAGDSVSNLDFEVFRLTEDISSLDSINSDAVFSIQGDALGRLENYSPVDGRIFRFFDPQFLDTLEFANVIRVPIGDDFSSEVLTIDGNEAPTSAELVPIFNGFLLTAETEQSAMVSFDISILALQSFFSLYYTGPDSIARVYNYPLGFDRPIVFEHDYTGTVIPDVLNVPVGGNDPLYLQGLNGVDVQVDISDMLRINDNIILNHAELEITLATEDTQNPDFPASPSLGLYRMDNNGRLVEIEDLELADLRGSREVVFDGTLNTTGTESTYSFNFTTHAKGILDGIDTGIIYISVFDKGADPSRTIVYGPDHDTSPMKLNLTFTRL